MDDSRVLVAGGVGKKKKAKKNPKATPSTATNQDVGSSQPVQGPEPIQQVPHQDQFEDMLTDDQFGSDQLHNFSEHFQVAEDRGVHRSKTGPDRTGTG
ncbi:unnamed protein product [Cuscuta europaea]|uniref:Uncharacterized protein n=1 Tax=Cuscuta europaea TaxID=41803 RepID=A0A9P0YYB4_CUSEU|nr:unnamed protein product [Cuscuta europaea]